MFERDVPDYCKPDNEVEIPKANQSVLHNLDGCTRLDAKESDVDEELCIVSGKDNWGNNWCKSRWNINRCIWEGYRWDLTAGCVSLE